MLIYVLAVKSDLMVGFLDGFLQSLRFLVFSLLRLYRRKTVLEIFILIQDLFVYLLYFSEDGIKVLFDVLHLFYLFFVFISHIAVVLPCVGVLGVPDGHLPLVA